MCCGSNAIAAPRILITLRERILLIRRYRTSFIHFCIDFASYFFFNLVRVLICKFSTLDVVGVLRNCNKL